jgi:hypothetical protein
VLTVPPNKQTNKQKTEKEIGLRLGTMAQPVILTTQEVEITV